jgi:hypothetical protein
MFAGAAVNDLRATDWGEPSPPEDRSMPNVDLRAPITAHTDQPLSTSDHSARIPLRQARASCAGPNIRAAGIASRSRSQTQACQTQA